MCFGPRAFSGGGKGHEKAMFWQAMVLVLCVFWKKKIQIQIPEVKQNQQICIRSHFGSSTMLGAPLQTPPKRRRRETRPDGIWIGLPGEPLQVVGYAVVSSVTLFKRPTPLQVRKIEMMSPPGWGLTTAHSTSREPPVAISITNCFALTQAVAVTQTNSSRPGDRFRLTQASYERLANATVIGSGETVGDKVGESLKYLGCFTPSFGLPAYVQQCLATGDAFEWVMYPSDARRLGFEVPENVMDFKPPYRDTVESDSDDELPATWEEDDHSHRDHYRHTAHDLLLYLEIVSLLKSPRHLRTVLELVADLFAGEFDCAK